MFVHFLIYAYFFRYDTYGATEEAIEEMCGTLGLEFNPELMQAEIAEVKKQNRLRSANHVMGNGENPLKRRVQSYLIDVNIDPLKRGGCYIPDQEISVRAPLKIDCIFDLDGTVQGGYINGSDYYIVLDTTPFLSATEEMHGDIGHLTLQNGTILNVTDVITISPGWILHKVKVSYIWEI